MQPVRCVTLELLRHGPPHNQLLSPLTEYLAMCGNHPAVTVRFPQEHAQFLARLGSLSYRSDRPLRELQVEDTARLMSDVLAQVPGLAADMPVAERRADQADGDRLTQLEIVLSASELALLPFELAHAPSGFPGAGQPLLLQAQNPLCLTRRVRRIEDRAARWDEPPSLLLIAAAPPTVGPIPLQRHVHALAEAVNPWVPMRLSGQPTRVERDPATGQPLGPFEAQYRGRLRILPAADVQQIQRICARERFTHVHILAHGKTYTQGVDERFGIVLHHPDDPQREDIVDGRRLAALLRTVDDWGRGGNMSPTVVTLASCDSGQQGSVIGAGASLAHAIHEAGIPLVVASQFPLTFTGSVIMAETLYHGLLRGYDPRLLLVKLRRELKARLPEAHDWASIVAYASFAPDFPRQLARLERLQARTSVDVALNEFNQLLATQVAGRKPPDDSDLHNCSNRLARAKGRLGRIVREGVGSARGHSIARLAAADKREAQIEFMLHESDPPDSWRRMHDLLDQARRRYLDAFQASRGQVWSLVQAVSLDVVQRGADADVDLWQLARILSDQDLVAADATLVSQSLANLAELYLLAPVFGPQPGLPNAGQCVSKAEWYAVELNRRTWDADRYWSTKYQIRRYYEWYGRFAKHIKNRPAREKLPSVAELAERIDDVILTQTHAEAT